MRFFKELTKRHEQDFPNYSNNGGHKTNANRYSGDFSEKCEKFSQTRIPDFNGRFFEFFLDSISCNLEWLLPRLHQMMR